MKLILSIFFQFISLIVLCQTIDKEKLRDEVLNMHINTSFDLSKNWSEIADKGEVVKYDTNKLKNLNNFIRDQNQLYNINTKRAKFYQIMNSKSLTFLNTKFDFGLISIYDSNYVYTNISSNYFTFIKIFRDTLSSKKFFNEYENNILEIFKISKEDCTSHNEWKVYKVGELDKNLLDPEVSIRLKNDTILVSVCYNVIQRQNWISQSDYNDLNQQFRDLDNNLIYKDLHMGLEITNYIEKYNLKYVSENNDQIAFKIGNPKYLEFNGIFFNNGWLYCQKNDEIMRHLALRKTSNVKEFNQIKEILFLLYGYPVEKKENSEYEWKGKNLLILLQTNSEKNLTDLHILTK